MFTGPQMTTAKTVVAALGTTLTAITTALAAVSLALADDAVDLTEVSAIVTAALTAGATVWGVWRVPNRIVRVRRSLDDQGWDEENAV